MASVVSAERIQKEQQANRAPTTSPSPTAKPEPSTTGANTGHAYNHIPDNPAIYFSDGTDPLYQPGSKNIWITPAGDKILDHLGIEAILRLRRVHPNWATAANVYMSRERQNEKLRNLNLHTEYRHFRRFTAFELIRRKLGFSEGPIRNNTFARQDTTHLAAIRADSGMLFMLKAHGANMSTTGANGQAPLNHACNQKHIQVVKDLISMGVRINTLNLQNRTPLHIAASRWAIHRTPADYTIVKILLNAGAHPSLNDDEGENATFLAARVRDNTLLKLFLSDIDNRAAVKLQNGLGLTLLHAACQAGSPSNARVLIDKGADINATVAWTKPKSICPTWAHIHQPGWPSTTAEAPPKCPSRYHWINHNTPSGLEYLEPWNPAACQADDWAPFRHTVNLGKTPLICAVISEDNISVKLLIKKGAEVNIQDYQGRTALHHAVKRNLRITTLLLKAGADPTIKDKRGRTPTDWTQQVTGALDIRIPRLLLRQKSVPEEDKTKLRATITSALSTDTPKIGPIFG